MQPDIVAYYPDPVGYLEKIDIMMNMNFGVSLLSPATSRVLILYNKVLKLFPALPHTCSAKRKAQGFVNSAHALAYHFCQALPAAFTQPGVRLLAKL